MTGETPQFAIDQWKKLLRCACFAAIDRLQNLRDRSALRHACF
jgi:hypothetical protein